MIKRFLVAALLAMLPLAAPADAAGRFTADITSLTPVMPARNSPISMDVQMANSTEQAITGITVRLVVSDAPLAGRSAVPAVFSSATVPTLRVLGDDAASGIDLASGASTAVTLTTTPEALGLRADRPGAYVVGALVRGTTDTGRAVSLRPVTLLPWMPVRPANGVLSVTTIWTVSAPPSRTVNGEFINDALARAVASGGRLDSQLRAMQTVDNSVWLVDPALLESVQSLAKGALIRSDDGFARAATNEEMQAATQWLQTFTRALPGHELAALPYADLDVRTALKFGHRAVVERALSLSASRIASVLGVTTVPLAVPLAVPLYGGAVTDSTWRFLADRGVTFAFVSDVGYPATQQTFTPNSSLDVPAFGDGHVLVVDQALSSAVVQTNLSPQERQQEFAAHLLMSYLERPSATRAVALLLPPDWLPGSQAVSVLRSDWIRSIAPAASAVVGKSARERDNIPATRAQRLQNDRMMAMIGDQRVLARLSRDPAFSTAVADAVSGAMSRWWTGRPAADRFTPLVSSELTALRESVRVVTRGEVVFGAERGVVPVTVANGLPVPIDITLLASGLPSVRVQSTGVTSLHINAGKRTSVEVPTRVTGSGSASLLLQLTTSDGELLNVPVVVGVRSAAYARVASYLVAAAFVALLLLVGINTVRRVRARRSGAGDDE